MQSEFEKYLSEGGFLYWLSEKSKLKMKGGRGMTLFTIGFGKKSAREFFSLLDKHGVKRVVDIRLNNKSQLAGFTKKDDLEYFLKAISGIDYIYLPEFAPTKDILDDYKNKKTSWQVYEEQYSQLITNRDLLKDMDMTIFDEACLLCSEPTAQRCHRRLLAEYVTEAMPELKIIHL